ncbi:alginate lyase [Chitinophaga dinghuensis]|uniref:Alginate lyase n=1 Tax=Chitinophaga dinghuensis TaxID=1539050 RepID=A0A327WIV4_9BACT|nr:alginate lyase family protein [Chitinophaga dinghuensis]RAJ87704.1 alginate lyase [Chitinophaga dinghuensis]
MKKNTLFYGLAVSLITATICLFSCGKDIKENPVVNNESQKPKTELTTFVHPGVLNTQASLDYVGGQVNGGDPNRTAYYQKVIDYVDSHPVPTSFYATVVVGSNGATSPSKSQIRKDAELAYALALRWAKTGTQSWADKCISVLNGWAYTFQNYALLDGSTNPNQPGLEASWTTPSFVAAAEIMRYYKVNGNGSGWSAADITQFQNYLNNVKNNYINNMPVYNNNWNASQGYAKMAMGIFLNSTTVYQNGYDLITTYVPIIIQSNGTIPEYCDRQDCVHFQYSLTAFAYAAQLAKIQQGDNSLWNLNSSRISAGYDYMRSAYQGSASCSYCSTSSPVFPGVEVAYNHYQTSNLSYLRGLQAPLSVPNDNTFLGFTTYTHYGVSSLQ